MSARASGASTTPNGEAKHRQHHDGSTGRAYTVEQKAAVVRILRCGQTAYYEILGLEKDCGEGDIRKAYKKMSLLTHPDKNGYEGTKEAFQMVAKAFSVLNDKDMRSKYDATGGDPSSRFGGAPPGGASGFSNFARSAGAQRQGMWEEEISPEEMFRQFFGGGGGFGGPFGGGLFDTGPQFVFNVGGGPGIRVHQFGGGRPRRRPGTAQPAGAEQQTSISSAISSLLPLLLLFVLPLLSSIFSGGSGPPKPPTLFDGPRSPYTQSRISHRLKIPYYVNPVEVEDYGKSKFRELDEEADRRYLHTLTVRCDNENTQRQRMEQEAMGWFFQDEVKMEQARRMEMPNCKKLGELGVKY